MSTPEQHFTDAFIRQARAAGCRAIDPSTCRYHARLFTPVGVITTIGCGRDSLSITCPDKQHCDIHGPAWDRGQQTLAIAQGDQSVGRIGSAFTEEDRAFGTQSTAVLHHGWYVEELAPVITAVVEAEDEAHRNPHARHIVYPAELALVEKLRHADLDPAFTEQLRSAVGDRGMDIYAWASRTAQRQVVSQTAWGAMHRLYKKHGQQGAKKGVGGLAFIIDRANPLGWRELEAAFAADGGAERLNRAYRLMLPDARSQGFTGTQVAGFLYEKVISQTAETEHLEKSLTPLIRELTRKRLTARQGTAQQDIQEGIDGFLLRRSGVPVNAWQMKRLSYLRADEATKNANRAKSDAWKAKSGEPILYFFVEHLRAGNLWGIPSDVVHDTLLHPELKTTLAGKHAIQL